MNEWLGRLIPPLGSIIGDSPGWLFMLIPFLIGIPISMLIAPPLAQFIYNQKAKRSRCENCGIAFSTEYLGSDVLSQGTFQEQERDRQGNYVTKYYKVGEREKHYKCEACGYKYKVIEKFKERL